ncbi:ABC transporter substrate-binding protein [Roseomonas xinghualingensis]|uniref:ABC transporter substrate-binding protein n=1 Tax=Roseomonas xinghualingensis TaxID=2986475 RepID=UPI0021F11D7C|nr:ABC transporter substrate-binding protein [Roseomonas sp. SXEYE001]MCV4210170.1 ABC transporter substrate-binding protein [Roseomonas sp. SXEYE001]
MTSFPYLPRRTLLSVPFALTPLERARAQAPNGPALTIGVGAPPTSMDPHFHNIGPNNAITMHVFDGLVVRDGQAQARPALAESWRVLSETEWEFRLRRNVRWHDGKPFTADDVVFTFERVPNVAGSPGSFGGFLRFVEKVDVLDPHLIRVRTRRPNPLLPLDLASVSIIARHVNGVATEDYNSGRAAVGTGPYHLVSYAANDRAVFKRNPDWWGGAEPWETVNYRFLANDASRTAALLSGDVDMIDQIPTSDLSKLRRDPRVTVNEIVSLRTMFMTPNHGPEGGHPHVTDTRGAPLPKNPFLDARVRQALSLAINREALASHVMEGAAVPTGQWLPEGAFGYNPAVRPDPFDPDAAKQLLAEAGYPAGFHITVLTPNDRWPNDARVTQAVAQMWTRVGVRTAVEALPFAAFVQRRSRHDVPMSLSAWGSATGEASNYLVNIVNTANREHLTGANNLWRHSDPAMDELTALASAAMDDASREALWHKAVERYALERPYIQLLQLTTSWATRRGLRYAPRMDERTVAMGVRTA